MVSWIIEQITKFLALIALALEFALFEAVLGPVGLKNGAASMKLFQNLFFGRGNDMALMYRLMLVLGFLILMFNFFVGIFKIILTNEDRLPSPGKLLYNTLKTAAWMFCAIPIMNGVLNFFGLLFNLFDLSNIRQTLDWGALDGFLSNPPSIVGALEGLPAWLPIRIVLAVCLASLAIMLVVQVFHFILNYAERYVLLGLLYLFAPACLATANNPSTEGISQKWKSWFLTQCMVLVLMQFFLAITEYASYNMLAGKLDKLDNYLSASSGVVAHAANGGGGTGFMLAQMLMILAWVKIGNNIENYLSTLGLTSMSIGQGLAGQIQDHNRSMAAASAKAGRTLGDYGKMRRGEHGRLASAMGAFAKNSNSLAGAALQNYAMGGKGKFAQSIGAAISTAKRADGYGYDMSESAKRSVGNDVANDAAEADKELNSAEGQEKLAQAFQEANEAQQNLQEIDKKVQETGKEQSEAQAQKAEADTAVEKASKAAAEAAENVQKAQHQLAEANNEVAAAQESGTGLKEALQKQDEAKQNLNDAQAAQENAVNALDSAKTKQTTATDSLKTANTNARAAQSEKQKEETRLQNATATLGKAQVSSLNQAVKSGSVKALTAEAHEDKSFKAVYQNADGSKFEVSKSADGKYSFSGNTKALHTNSANNLHDTIKSSGVPAPKKEAIQSLGNKELTAAYNANPNSVAQVAPGVYTSKDASGNVSYHTSSGTFDPNSSNVVCSGNTMYLRNDSGDVVSTLTVDATKGVSSNLAAGGYSNCSQEYLADLSGALNTMGLETYNYDPARKDAGFKFEQVNINGVNASQIGEHTFAMSISEENMASVQALVGDSNYYIKDGMLYGDRSTMEKAAPLANKAGFTMPETIETRRNSKQVAEQQRLDELKRQNGE